jgi:hypothetical protein
MHCGKKCIIVPPKFSSNQIGDPVLHDVCDLFMKVSLNFVLISSGSCYTHFALGPKVGTYLGCVIPTGRSAGH